MRTEGLLDCGRIDRATDHAELVADLASEKQERDDGQDGDESKDECIFGEALTVDVALERLELPDQFLLPRHVVLPPFRRLQGDPDGVTRETVEPSPGAFTVGRPVYKSIGPLHWFVACSQRCRDKRPEKQ